jgi:Zn-dependent peptidase ImmA (M78 family)/transcriptional regulator with XRE-family HTH domain
MNDFRKNIGYRIRSARERLGISQQVLAEKIGISAHQIISQIEKGEREVKAWELAEFSKILRVDISRLLTPTPTEEPPIILWRKIPGAEKEIKEADFRKHCEEYYKLEQLCDFPPYPKLPKKEINPNTINFQEIGEIAEEVSRELALGTRPAASLEQTLQDRYGVKIWYENLGSEGSAASTISSFGPAILMNLKEAPWRRNYNFAHELFHLITWESIPPDLLINNSNLFSKVESFANAFASHLLLPADIILNEFNKRVKNYKIHYSDLIEIAREFDVSTEALLYRLCNLGQIDIKEVEKLINDPDFKNKDRSTMHGHWWDPPPIPEKFVFLGFKAYQKGKVSRSRLAEYLETSLFDLNDKLLEYGLDENEDYETEVRTTRR